MCVYVQWYWYVYSNSLDSKIACTCTMYIHCTLYIAVVIIKPCHALCVMEEIQTRNTAHSEYGMC